MKKQPYQRIRIHACSGASVEQSSRQIIEEADALRGAALPCEVRSGAVCEGCVVGICAGGVEAADLLEVCEREGGNCWQQVNEDQGVEEREGGREAHCCSLCDGLKAARWGCAQSCLRPLDLR